MLKISYFYLDKQKSFIPKKNFFKPLSISKQKSFVYWLNFPEGFGFYLPIIKAKRKISNCFKFFIIFTIFKASKNANHRKILFQLSKILVCKYDQKRKLTISEFLLIAQTNLRAVVDLGTDSGILVQGQFGTNAKAEKKYD